MAKLVTTCNDRNSPVMAKWARAEIRRRKLCISEIAAKVGLSERSLERRLNIGLSGKGNYKPWDIGFMESLAQAMGHGPLHLSSLLDGYWMRDRELGLLRR